MTGSSKIYTRTGDKGKTSLIGGTRVSKSHIRLDAYGTLDELNSVIGLMRFHMTQELSGDEASELQTICHDIQNDLFNLGSHLACEDVKLRSTLPSVGQLHIDELEKMMDEFSKDLTPLKNFILPGGSGSASTAHIARTVCRRAERLCVSLLEDETEEIEADIVRYVNRLSDFLFVFARYLNHLAKREEILWAPKKK